MRKNKKWVKPILTVLTRDANGSELVLASCKSGYTRYGGGNNATWGYCLVTSGPYPQYNGCGPSLCSVRTSS
jgi:hypothetical protein